MRLTLNYLDGLKVAEMRDRQGLTTTALAAKVGISGTHMSRIERNERFGSPDVRRRIAAALGVDIAELRRETAAA